MSDVLFDRAPNYRKRAQVLRSLAEGMVRSGGNGDILRRLAAEYEKMAAALDDFAAKEKTTAAARNLPAAP